MSELDEVIATQAKAFNDLRVERHKKGEEKYGHLTFLGNDVIRMMLEELADLANYIEYEAAKLLFLQQALESDPRLGTLATGGQITIGLESFKGTGEGWKK